MPPVLISRFLINLRRVDYQASEHDIDNEEYSQSMTVNFRIPTVQSVIGNLGETLYDGIEERSQCNLPEDMCNVTNEAQGA